MLHVCGDLSMLLMLCIFSYAGWRRGCLDDERLALLEVMGYQSDYSPFGTYSANSDDCCMWEWVECSPTSSRVVRIFIYGSTSGEEEHGWHPDMNLLAQLKELQQLILRRNGIFELLNPEALCKLKNLQELDLSQNSIEVHLPLCLSNMSSLKILNLANNRFQGDLSIFSNLSKIEKIDVSHNLFQGLIQLSIFANLSKLSYLDFSYNYHLEVESESPTWHASFQIQHLFLAGCNLNRQNSLIPHFISTQSNLQTLDMSNNFLEGSFPIWMLHNVTSVLRLRGNSFTGQFPHAYRNTTSTIVDLDISNIHLDGPLPSNISVFLPKLYRFNAFFCGFSGSIPPSLGDLQNLERLNLSSNHFSGINPSGLTTNSPLWYLNLSNNSLRGDLLPKDCNMTQLKWLLLHNNKFVRNILTCLSNNSSLLMLDVRYNLLSGEISGKMPAFAELGALLLRANQFRGLIPRLLCQMQKLQFLDLSNNDFSGPIPFCLSNN